MGGGEFGSLALHLVGWWVGGGDGATGPNVLSVVLSRPLSRTTLTAAGGGRGRGSTVDEVLFCRSAREWYRIRPAIPRERASVLLDCLCVCFVSC